MVVRTDFMLNYIPTLGSILGVFPRCCSRSCKGGWQLALLALLDVPLTVGLVIAWARFDSTRWIALLLSDAPEEDEVAGKAVAG